MRNTLQALYNSAAVTQVILKNLMEFSFFKVGTRHWTTLIAWAISFCNNYQLTQYYFVNNNALFFYKPMSWHVLAFINHSTGTSSAFAQYCKRERSSLINSISRKTGLRSQHKRERRLSNWGLFRTLWAVLHNCRESSLFFHSIPLLLQIFQKVFT